MQKQVKPVSVRELWAKVPAVDCEGCGACCGPVEMAPVEKQVIIEYCQRNNIPLKNFFAPLAVRYLDVLAGYWQCSMRKDGGCLLYEVRPLICRLQGCTPKLPCPNASCRKYPLSDAAAGALLQRSWRASR